MTSGNVLGKPFSREQRAELALRKNRLDYEIDDSDIAPLTDEQLAIAFQPNLQLVAVRLDRDVMAWLREFGPGYSTRIKKILRIVTEQRKGQAFVSAHSALSSP